MAFSVGDWVIITKPANVDQGPRWATGMNELDGTVQRIESHGTYYHAGGWSMHEDWLTKVPAPVASEVEETIKQEKLKMSSTMNLITAKLTAEQRYAKTNGFIYDSGALSPLGRDALLQFLYGVNEKAFIKACKDADKSLRAAAAADAAELAVDSE